MPRGRQPKQYDPDLVARVRGLYGSGLTQSEVAVSLGMSQKMVWNLMRRHGIQARKAAKRDQGGEKNTSWKGDKASYQALHLRVESIRGKPKKCDRCGIDDPDKYYDWANLNGNYTDIHDYERMCRSCHRLYDNERRPC